MLLLILCNLFSLVLISIQDPLRSDRFGHRYAAAAAAAAATAAAVDDK